VLAPPPEELELVDEEVTEPVGGASSEDPAAQAARARVEAASRQRNDEVCMAPQILENASAARQTACVGAPAHSSAQAGRSCDTAALRGHP